MPLFMDRHDIAGLTPEEIAEGHARDLAVQGQYDVEYLTYWHDPAKGVSFCLAQGPSREAVEQVHREAHGMIASQVIEVDMRAVEAFLGRVVEPTPGVPFVETAFRTILFTDMESSTERTQALGDAGAMRLVRTHDRIVRTALEMYGGTEVKHTGDGIMASFVSVSKAVECAIAIQRRLAEASAASEDDSQAITIRIGLAAGEPVTEGNDLFGVVVQLASRLCSAAEPRTILAPSTIRDLTAGKGFAFERRGDFQLKGFPEPVAVVEVRWA